jgi:hypothetical protein
VTVPEETADAGPIGAPPHITSVGRDAERSGLGALPPAPPLVAPVAARPDDAPADEAAVRSWRHDVVVFALVVVALELAALPVGLLWGALAPHPQYQVNGHQIGLVLGDAKPLVRGDGLFLLVTGLAGGAAGALVFWRARRAEIGATLALAVGGLLAGWLAWRVGHDWTGGTQPSTLAGEADGTKARLAADLGARTVLVSWAVAAVAAHGLLYAITWPAKPKPDAEPLAQRDQWPGPVTEA